MIQRNKKGQFVSGKYVGFGFKKGQKVWNKNKKGIHLSPKSEFKKGMIPWNKGTIGLTKVNSGVIKKGERRSMNTEFNSKNTTGEKNFNWKGDKVGYFGLHTWLQRNFGKANKCQNRIKQFLPFRCTKKSFNFDWANRSRDYKREISDWVDLCHSCHLTADKRKLSL